MSKQTMDAAKIQRLAKAIIDNMEPWTASDYSFEGIVEALEKNPLSIVEYLIDTYVEA